MLQNFHRPPDRFQTCLKDRLIRKGQTELPCTEWVFAISTAPAGISGARLPDNAALYGICFHNNSYVYGDLNHLVKRLRDAPATDAEAEKIKVAKVVEAAAGFDEDEDGEKEEPVVDDIAELDVGDFDFEDTCVNQHMAIEDAS